MIYSAGNKIAHVYHGDRRIKMVWSGDKLVYPDGPSFQAYKWLSAYRPTTDTFNGYAPLNSAGTTHYFQPRASLLSGSTGLDGAWVSNYSDGDNWMVDKATAGTWRFTVAGTLYNNKPLPYGYTGQYLSGGYMVQGIGGASTDVFYNMVAGASYDVPVGSELDFTYTFQVTKPVTTVNWYFVPVLLNDASSAPIVFDIYDLVIAGAKIA